MTAARGLVLVVLLACSGSSNEAPAVCGDGVATGAEACDGADVGGMRCADLGFNSGTVTCNGACLLDTRGCANVEVCDNGVDDDGDGDKDCDDAACADGASCASCGDGRVSGAETCDDGNATAGDCCDACRAELSCEQEVNDTNETAMPLAGSLRGRITPAGDVDIYQVAVPAGSTGTVTAEITAFDEPAACFGEIDTRVEILGSDGRMAGVDDDAGAGTCSRARGAGLPPGAAYVRVAASPFARVPSFGYRLTVGLELSPCGDGVAQEGQECDDGNGVGGDGCSAGCRLEDVAEHEPNEARETAGGPLAPPFSVAAVIDPPSAGNVDTDWVALDVRAAGTVRVETQLVDAASCASKVVLATLHDAAGAALATAGAPGPDARSCGLLAAPVAAGRHYVRVTSRPSPGKYRLVVTIGP